MRARPQVRPLTEVMSELRSVTKDGTAGRRAPEAVGLHPLSLLKQEASVTGTERGRGVKSWTWGGKQGPHRPWKGTRLDSQSHGNPWRVGLVGWLVFFYCAGSLSLHEVFSGYGEWGLLCSCSTPASYCGGFSCCRVQVLGHSGFSSCSPWAQ